MGADLFGSFAESTCAALVVASVSQLGASHDWIGMMFPLFVTASGIIVCLLTTLLATDISPARSIPTIEPTLKTQLIVSTLLMTPVVLLVAFITLPTTFTMPYPGDKTIHVHWYYMFFCVCSGLWGGMVIGVATEYYTSNTYSPVREVADACRTGAATNIIFGLALGYLSVIIPVFVIACCVYVGACPACCTYRKVTQTSLARQDCLYSGTRVDNLQAATLKCQVSWGTVNMCVAPTPISS
jgi:H+-translocating diphosphatase